MKCRLRHLLRERDVRGVVDEQVLSVYRDLGVVPKMGRTDNFNKTPEDLSNYKLVLQGDVVVNKMKAWQGSIAVSSHRGIVSGDYLVCEVVAKCEGRYLHHLLRSRPLIAQYQMRSKGIRPSQWRLYWEDLAEIAIDLPTLQEQRTIASVLDRESSRIDAIIRKKGELVASLDERLTATIDRAIMSSDGVMRPIANLARYKNGWPFKPGDFGESGVPVIRIEQLVDPDAPVDRYSGNLPDDVRLRDGDLVFSWSGSLQVRIWNRGPAYLNQHLFRVIPAVNISKSWLRFVLELSTRLFQEHMHGSAMTHITQPMMKLVRVPVPTLGEQERIADLLSERYLWTRQIEARLAEQLELLRERRQSLITEAVVRPPDDPGFAAA